MGSTRQKARLAGLLYLLLGITNLYGLLCVPLVQRNASAIAHKIATSEGLFRINIVCDLLSQVMGIFLALLLYQLLRPVNQSLARAMVVLFLISVPVSFLLTLNDVAARILLTDAEVLSTFTKPQSDALAILFIKLHIHGIFAVEIYWGLWLIPFGLLVIKSRCIPPILGILLIVAGVAYATHSLVSLLLPEFQNTLYERVTMVARGAGELPVMFWLLIKGADLKHPLDELPAQHTQ